MKLQITIGSGTLAGRTFDLESGFLTIGRGDNCSIRFDPMSERIASKQHAFIEAKADGYYLTDNQSTNGTFLNGNPVTTAKLTSGDQVQFGRNGVTDAVTIDTPEIADAPEETVVRRQESFRDFQVQQFNQTVAQQPVSMQTSLANFGLGSVAVVKPEEPSATSRYIGIGITLFVALVLFFIVVGILFSNLGPVLAVIAAIVAFIPAFIYVLPLIWLDRYDPEPIWLLALAFAWGALVSIPIAYFFNTEIGSLTSAMTDPATGRFVSGVISAPIFEEGSKGIGVVLIMIIFRRYFDDILDGIVFAGVIALGFATVENVLYYGGMLGNYGGGGLLELFILRGIASPYIHVTFTSMTGIGCGISRESHNKLLRVVAPVGGYFVAVTLHAIWNGVIAPGDIPTFAVKYIILGVPFFFIAVAFALFVMLRQGKILREMLAIDIARGLITPELGKTVTSAFRSSGWLISGLFSGKFRARNRYLRAVGKLGLSYWHIQRATAAQGQTASFQQNPILREEVLRWRDKV